MKRMIRRLFWLIIAISLLASAAFASEQNEMSFMSVYDFVKLNGVVIDDDSSICIKSNDSESSEQYIEVTNYLPNGMIEKSFIKPYAVNGNAKGKLIDSEDGIIPARSTGYVPVNFSNVSITVTTQAYYTGSAQYGYVPSGVTAKWTRGAGTTNTVDSLMAEYFIRGILIDLSTGDPVDPNNPEILYYCPLTRSNPNMNVYYSKYKTLDQSGTGIWTGYAPLYGGGVVITIVVNGVVYQDDFGL